MCLSVSQLLVAVHIIISQSSEWDNTFAKHSFAKLASMLVWRLKDCINSPEKDNEETLKLPGLCNKSCSIRFRPIAQLRNISGQLKYSC